MPAQPLRVREVIYSILGIVGIAAGIGGLITLNRPIQAPSFTSTANTTVGKDLTVNDDAAIGGQVDTTSTQRRMHVALNFSASTQTLAIFPLPTNPQVLRDLVCSVSTSTATGGSIRLTASMGTGYATGSTMGTDLFYDNTVDLASVANSSPWITPTSTLPGVVSSTAGTVYGDGGNPLNYSIRFGNVYRGTNKLLIIKNASPTSTGTGYCSFGYSSAYQVGN